MPEHIMGIEQEFESVCGCVVSGGGGELVVWLLSQNDLLFPEVKFSLRQLIINYSNTHKSVETMCNT